MKTHFAIRLMIAQAVLFAIETAVIHAIGARVSIMTLAFVRSAGGVVLALALARKAGVSAVRTRQGPLQLLRGTVSLLYLWVMIYSFAHMPFADATAISYTQAAYIAVFSALILGEVVTGSRWAASAIGIAGALLIAKPGFVGWNAVYLIALLGTSLNGLSFVLNRYLQREDNEATTLFYSNLVPLLGNLPALAFAGLPGVDTLFWLPGLLFLGPLGMLAGIVAVRHAEASMLAPYTLLRLVVSIAAGLVLFHEAPDVLSGIGAGAILASCLMATSILSSKAIRRLYWRLWTLAGA
jgi:drug/metabolite transporter (DMT)-like permease